MVDDGEEWIVAQPKKKSVHNASAVHTRLPQTQAARVGQRGPGRQAGGRGYGARSNEAARDFPAFSRRQGQGAGLGVGRGREVTLGVISGLPGLGKSFYFKQVQNALATASYGYEELNRRVCIVLKDAVSTEFRDCSGHKATQRDVLNVTVERLAAAAAAAASSSSSSSSGVGMARPESPLLLLFNMNINTDWISQLVALLEENDFRLCKVVVLAPPAEVPFARLHASAVVLASDLRTGTETADLASTLLPHKAWEVLSGGFFSRPSAICPTRDLCEAVAETLQRQVPFHEVHYPVPLLRHDLEFPEAIPVSRPSAWTAENLVFPSEEDTAESVRRFFVSAAGC